MHFYFLLVLITCFWSFIINSASNSPDDSFSSDSSDFLDPYSSNDDTDLFASTTTDVTLENICSQQQSLSDDQQLPLTARDGASVCDDSSSPLSPETIELFQDPFSALGKSSQLPPLSYPGRLSPEEEEKGGSIYNPEPDDENQWQIYRGKITFEPQPCRFVRDLGFVFHLCCDGEYSEALPESGLFLEYLWVEGCSAGKLSNANDPILTFHD